MKIAIHIRHNGDEAIRGVEIPLDADEHYKNRAIRDILKSAEDYLKKLVFEDEQLEE